MTDPTDIDATHPALAEAVRRLRAGDLAAFPTETVYGLGADATSPTAVARIFATKGRPQFNPLIAHVATRDQAVREAVFSRHALHLAERFWPGPLTLVLPRADGGSVCDLACAGLASVGLRIPSHPVAHALLAAVGRPIAAPSANISGKLSPTRASDVVAAFGPDGPFVLDGGPCDVGVESTIVACDGDLVVLLRPGGIPTEDIEAAIGRRLEAAPQAVMAPGMMASHYAPQAALRLDATKLDAGEVGLDFGRHLDAATLDLSPSGDLREAAANLYGFLRRLDARAMRIAVAPIPARGLGLAINDRLRRAAAPRPAT